MEICDKCGKTIQRTTDNLHGCGDLDSGYFCEECWETQFEYDDED